MRLLARGYYPPILSLIFEMLRLPAVLPATLVIFAPGRARTFQVTPKGRSESDAARRAPVPRLYAALIALTAASLAWSGATFAGLTPTHYAHPGAVAGAACFLIANQLLVIAAIRRIRRPRYAGERRESYRFPLAFSGRLNGRPCRIEDVSLTGAHVRTEDAAAVFAIDQTATLEIELEHSSERLECTVRRLLADGDVGLSFDAGSADVARLALALFQPSALKTRARRKPSAAKRRSTAKRPARAKPAAATRPKVDQGPAREVA